MKHSIKIFLACLAFICLLQGCYKDKGDYDIIDYNQITSLGTAGSVIVILGDTLKMKPVIKWKYPDRDTTAFDFKWVQVDSVVSTEKNLAYVPDISGYFNLYLYVTEKATGIVSRYAMQIQATSPYKAGWLLLTKDASGKSGLSYVRRDTKRDASNQVYYEYKYYPDLYANSFPEDELGENPIRLVTKAFPDWTLDEVVVLQGNTPVYLDGDNLKKVIRLKSEFPGQAFPNNATPVNYNDGAAANYVLTDDGKIYWKRNSVGMGGIHEGTFMDVPIYFENGDAKITQFFENENENTYFVYMYDSLNRRFLGLFATNGTNDFLGSKLFLVNDNAPPAGFIDLNDQTGYSLMYASDFASGYSFMNIIKNDNTGQYLYQTYKLNNTWFSIGVSDHFQEVFAGDALVSDNTVYYRIRNSSYLFFGEGSKLYFYDVNTKKVTLYHDFGSGRIVKITSDANSGELGVAFDNGKFYICSLKNEVLGNASPGSVGILFTSPAMNPIVDLAWKWGSYYEYIFKRYPQ
jgi:hypothetical protein